MIEKYIYLLAKSYFIVFTVFFILNIINSYSKEYKQSINNKKLKNIEKGSYHTLPIYILFLWVIYYLSILIYFKL